VRGWVIGARGGGGGVAGDVGDRRKSDGVCYRVGEGERGGCGVRIGREEGDRCGMWNVGGG